MGKEILNGKKILVAGGGISGIGAAGLLHKAGYPAAIYDGNPNLDPEALKEKLPQDMEVILELGTPEDQLAKSYDLLILSPGIPLTSPVASAFYAENKVVIGEIELASLFSKGRIAAITGTNGKTTTTALVGEILAAYYSSVFVVGNIGIPFTSVATDTRDDSVIAAEISSFQLETTMDFCPEVSAVLNVTPDHLDRHGTMEVYASTKASIAKKQNKNQVMVLNYDDPLTRAMAETTPARPVMFSRICDLPAGILLRDIEGKKTFVVREEGEDIPICSTDEIHLLGSHNHENILAAIGVAWYMGVPASCIRKAVMDFRAVEHRIEYVDTVDGVDYYNDSKGTNPDAAIKGIQAMVKPTVLIGGGYDKKATYDEWIESFDGKVRCLILLGATAKAIGETAEKHGFTDIIYVESFEEAMECARKQAHEGDAVLLSPACASWGMFKNYEVRGQRFKEIVRSFKSD